MKLFDMSSDARRSYVAALLHLNPNEPLTDETRKMIDDLLDRAETTAQRALEQDCYHLANR